MDLIRGVLLRFLFILGFTEFVWLFLRAADVVEVGFWSVLWVLLAIRTTVQYVTLDVDDL